ncbi:MAG: hypothetical protein K2X81_14995 [Candidatus Obscuribacterales bacterium]|nr:hypothetical protein [Candidatus Obscuribacterales bacterium]
MALISKTTLVERGKYTYTWLVSPGDNPNVTGKPDSIRLSKKEGYEVVYFINAYADKHSLKTQASAYQIEDLMHESSSIMRADVIKCIELNWKN